MKKGITVLFLTALVSSAGIIPGGACASGTFVEYAALGVAGCTIEGRLFNNFAPSAGIVLTVTPNDSGSDASVGLTFASLQPLTVDTPALSIAYSVATTSATLITRSGVSFALGPMSTGAATLFFLANPLPSYPFTPSYSVSETPTFSAKTETLPQIVLSVNRVHIFDQIQVNAFPSDFTVNSFTNTFLNVPGDTQVIPEPGTLLCAGIGILLLCARRAMARGRC